MNRLRSKKSEQFAGEEGFKKGADVRGEVIHCDSPYGSILRPNGAEGGRLGPSIISGGDGAPPLTGEGPYESPVTIGPWFYSKKTSD